MASLLKRVALIFLIATNADAATWVSDGSDTGLNGVQHFHDVAADGDTVVIPPGTFTWNTGITCTKAITFQGQTTVVGDHTTYFAGTYPTNKPTVNDQTILIDNVTAGTFINASNNNTTKVLRFTGLTFRGNTRITNPTFAIQLASTSRMLRVDHCHSDQMNRPWTFGIFGDGIIDHCYITPRSGTQEFEVRNRVGANGDEEFTEDGSAFYGTNRFWFIEDCYVDNNISPVNAAGGSDRTNAGRVIWRYCFMHNTEVVDHGTYSGRRRGGRVGEEYNNVQYWDAGTSLPATHVNSMDGITSGSIVYHDNLFTGPDRPTGWNLRDYRTFAGTDTNWGGAGGQNPWDINVTRADGTHVNGEAPFVFYGPDTVIAEFHPTCPGGSGSTMTLTVAGSPWTPNQWAYYTAVRSPDTPGVTNYIGQIISNTTNQLTMRWYSEACAGFPVGSTFRIYKLLGPALDQPGMGKGDLISPATPPVPPAVGVGIHQQIEPCYAWNNFYEPGHVPVVIQTLSDSSQVIIQNLHYFNNTVKPGYTPFTYPHPLVGGPNNTFLSNLYAYYKLDEASGGATDSSGNGKSLSNFGDAIGMATGIINGSRDFDGVSGTTLIRNANTTDFFCGANPFSFSFWVKFDTLPMSNNVGLCNRYEPFGQREYMVYLKQSTSKITFNIDAADGVHSASVAWGTVASPGVWYHVAGGWDGTNIKLSINAGTFVTAPYFTAMTNGGDKFKLGYEAQSLDGKMDEFGFWIGRCLTQSEVGQLYNNGSGLPFASFH